MSNLNVTQTSMYTAGLLDVQMLMFRYITEEATEQRISV